jgi:hypothetical protein
VSHQVLREILRDIQATLVPRTMMKEWALNTFSTPSDYWMFRKTVFGISMCTLNLYSAGKYNCSFECLALILVYIATVSRGFCRVCIPFD